MKKWLFLIIFFSSSAGLNAQSTLYLKLAPQNVLHPEHPLIPMSLEYHYQKFGIEYEHGFQADFLRNNWRTDRPNLSYFRSQLSLRYYFDLYKVNQFIGFNVSYLPYRYTSINDWYKTTSGHRLQYERSEVTRYKFRYLATYGFKIPLKKGYIFELVTGLGIRNRLVVHQPTGITPFVDPYIRNEWIRPFDRDSGSSNVPSFYFSMRIGYELFKSEHINPKTD